MNSTKLQVVNSTYKDQYHYCVTKSFETELKKASIHTIDAPYKGYFQPSCGICCRDATKLNN